MQTVTTIGLHPQWRRPRTLSSQKGKTDRARSHPPDCVRTGQASFQPNGVTAECRPLHVQGYVPDC
jgi:hypothetical protein